MDYDLLVLLCHRVVHLDCFHDRLFCFYSSCSCKLNCQGLLHSRIFDFYADSYPKFLQAARAVLVSHLPKFDDLLHL